VISASNQYASIAIWVAVVGPRILAVRRYRWSQCAVREEHLRFGSLDLFAPAVAHGDARAVIHLLDSLGRQLVHPAAVAPPALGSRWRRTCAPVIAGAGRDAARAARVAEVGQR
jgi:hypothetical protein